jgi:ribosomal-protein-alanine N-acetyltransferase
MQSLRLIEINCDGTPSEELCDLPEVALKACASTGSHYQNAGYSPPWIGYLAVCGSEVVGTCAFTAAPSAGRVEIAYYTFPPFDGRGVASAMASQLISIARAAQPELEIFAQTLPEPNASNAILRKLGFELFGRVDHAEEGSVWEWRLAPRISSRTQPIARVLACSQVRLNFSGEISRSCEIDRKCSE